MKLGVDLDGVLANFAQEYRRVGRLLTGKPATDVDPVDWDGSNYGWTPQNIEEIWKHIADRLNFWLSLGVLPGTVRVFEAVMRHDVTFITNRAKSRGASVRHQSAYWLHRAFGMDFPQVIVAANKGEVVKALGIEAFIDDNIDNVRDVKTKNPECRVFLMDASHNRNFDNEKHGIERIESFDAFLRRVEEVEQEAKVAAA